MSKFLTYKKFQTAEEASELIDILKQNKVAFEIEDNSSNFNSDSLNIDWICRGEYEFRFVKVK